MTPAERAKADIRAICQAIDNYCIVSAGRAPSSLDVLLLPDEDGTIYLKTLPLDPWGGAYIYRQPVGSQGYVVGCYGSDRSPGGEGDAADLSNQTVEGNVAPPK